MMEREIFNLKVKQNGYYIFFLILYYANLPR